MLHLLESAGHPRQQRAGWTATVSATAHAALVALVAMIGTREVITRPAPAPPEQLVYTAPRPATASPAPAAHAPTNAPVVTPTIDVPRNIVASFSHIIDRVIPTRLSEFPTGPATPGPGVTGPGVPGPVTLPGGGVYSERAVDRAVLPLTTNRNPEYPALLRSANVQGDVIVRFVVDTTGRVEPSSIEVARATHELFAESVRRWLVKNRYAPATISGMPVRQMVEQRVEFTLK